MTTRRDQSSSRLIPILIICCIMLSGCPGLVPGSKMYSGLSAVEQEHFKKASRDIYPNDVRKSIQQFQSNKVAWPGFITKSEWMEKDGAFATKFQIEHHYYDWILDYSIQKEKIFLSPRGEGTFATVCTSRPDQEAKVTTAPGNLLIVYGMPEKVEGGIVFLTCDYASFIKREWVRTDVFDYGRPGEPVKALNIPGPGAGTILRKAPPQ